jgi:hypothetical protein
LIVAHALASVLGNGIPLGNPSNDGSVGKLIQYALVALLIALALKNYVRRESVEPPRWLGALQNADPKTALKTGVLVIWLMPGDIVVLLTVATNLKHNDARLLTAPPFIAATLLIAALPAALRAVPPLRPAAHARGARLDEHAQLASERHHVRRVHRANPMTARLALRAPLVSKSAFQLVSMHACSDHRTREIALAEAFRFASAAAAGRG